MAISKKKSSDRTKTAKKKAPKSGSDSGAIRKRSTSSEAATGPVTLEEAKALAQSQAPKRTLRRSVAKAERAATHETVALERKNLSAQIEAENDRRIREYKAVVSIMKKRGVKGLASTAPPAARRRAPGTALAGAAGGPLQIFAEGDSWFDYPVPFFGGGVISRLEKRLGVPILSLAKAGDEVRNMMGVEERRVLSNQLSTGSPAGGNWDVLLFSGGGNDIVGNPMALWVEDFNAGVPPANLINKKRFQAALDLVRAGYEDLIRLRDTLSPNTQLIFHGYDFAIPDGRGICGSGPWLKPTFDLRGFPGLAPSVAVVNSMLQQFATMLQSLATSNDVSFINTQGTLSPVPASWHNELHPSKDGFNKVAAIFHANLKTLFPGRVL